jgi:ferritin-like metal-binding protein YciE
VKDVTANFMGAVQGMATTLMPDDVVKNALLEYALEHFEIASYSALIAAAEDAGQMAIAHTCSELLREETQMALWLEEEIPKLARQFVQQSAAAT